MNIDVHDIESDLEEEISPSTYVCCVTIPTSLPPTFSITKSARNPFGTMTPQHTFSEIKLSHILSSTNGTPPVSVHIPIVTYFFNVI